MQAACYESLPPSRALLLTLRAKSEASVGQGGQTMLQVTPARDTAQCGGDRSGERNPLGMCAQRGSNGFGGGNVRSNDAGIRKDGGVAEGTENRIGGDGKHGSLLDRATRSIGAARIGSGAGEHTRTGPSTGAEEERPRGLPVEPAAAQLRTADGLVPTERAGVPVADIGAR